MLFPLLFIFLLFMQCHFIFLKNTSSSVKKQAGPNEDIDIRKVYGLFISQVNLKISLLYIKIKIKILGYTF